MTVTVNSPNAHIIVPAGTTVNTLKVVSVSESSIEVLGKVNEIVIESDKTVRIYGAGLEVEGHTTKITGKGKSVILSGGEAQTIPAEGLEIKKENEEPEVPVEEDKYAEKPEGSKNIIENLTEEEYNGLKVRIKNGGLQTELTLEQLKEKAQSTGFNVEKIKYDNQTLTFEDSIMTVEKFKEIKSSPSADKSKPYKVTIIIGEHEYKLAFYLNTNTNIVESAIEFHK